MIPEQHLFKFGFLPNLKFKLKVILGDFLIKALGFITNKVALQNILTFDEDVTHNRGNC